jgi:hypothetical protein
MYCCSCIYSFNHVDYVISMTDLLLVPCCESNIRGRSRLSYECYTAFTYRVPCGICDIYTNILQVRVLIMGRSVQL